uniref:Ankyrin repeat domain-containing protein 16 n=1 Tax=Plectus sambesii TaxID=2011161 RepID=A0A914UUG3_9BILA
MADHWLDPVNKLNDSQVLLAARTGNVDQFEKAISEIGSDFASAGATLSKHSNRLGKTVLHEAAQNGRARIVEICLSQLGMDPDGIKQGDWTPLMLACTKLNNNTIVQQLIDSGANLNLKNKDGWTAFHVACREGDHHALEQMLAKQATIWNSTSKNGRTPLHTGAMFGRLAAVQLLLSKCQFPVDQGDSCGSTPLMDALRCGHIDVAKILIDLGKADVFARDSLGRSPLHLAAQAGQTTSLDFLINVCGVSVNLLTEGTRQSAVHHAAKEGHVEALRQLCNLGAGCQSPDSRGRTPLHLAAIAQQADSVQFLLNECSVVDSIDLAGNLAASFATKCPVISAFSSSSTIKQSI